MGVLFFKICGENLSIDKAMTIISIHYYSFDLFVTVTTSTIFSIKFTLREQINIQNETSINKSQKIL